MIYYHLILAWIQKNIFGLGFREVAAVVTDNGFEAIWYGTRYKVKGDYFKLKTVSDKYNYFTVIHSHPNGTHASQDDIDSFSGLRMGLNCDFSVEIVDCNKSSLYLVSLNKNGVVAPEFVNKLFDKKHLSKFNKQVIKLSRYK